MLCCQHHIQKIVECILLIQVIVCQLYDKGFQLKAVRWKVINKACLYLAICSKQSKQFGQNSITMDTWIKAVQSLPKRYFSVWEHIGSIFPEIIKIVIYKNCMEGNPRSLHMHTWTSILLHFSRWNLLTLYAYCQLFSLFPLIFNLLFHPDVASRLTFFKLSQVNHRWQIFTSKLFLRSEIWTNLILCRWLQVFNNSSLQNTSQTRCV